MTLADRVTGWGAVLVGAIRRYRVRARARCLVKVRADGDWRMRHFTDQQLERLVFGDNLKAPK